MRSAMVQRRIDKEKKRKQKEREIEEARRRDAVAKMNAGMAKVFREFIAKKSAEVNAEKAEGINKHKSQLAAKLKAWSKKVDHERVERGGESSEVWNLKTQQEEEKEKLAAMEPNSKDAQNNTQPSAAQALSAQEQAINQLFVRVLKVERLIEKIEKKKETETPANNNSGHARRGSEVQNLSASGDSRRDSRRGSAINLAAMLLQGKNNLKSKKF